MANCSHVYNSQSDELDCSAKGARLVLVDARDILSNHTRWTQRSTARDLEGRPTDPCGPTAVAWDLRGAIAAAAYAYGLDPRVAWSFVEMVAIRREALDSLHAPSLRILNDSSTWEQVLDALDEAIALLDAVVERGQAQRSSDSYTPRAV